jgi:hypothetical protein
MAMTEITVTTSLATTAVVALSGVNRIRADNMVQGGLRGDILAALAIV